MAKAKIAQCLELSVALWVVTPSMSACAPGAAEPGSQHSPSKLCLERRQIEFEPSSRADLQRLEREMQLESEADSAATNIQRSVNLHKKIRRGLREITFLTEALLECDDTTRRQGLRTQLLEAVAAVNNLRRSPMPGSLDFFETPLFFFERLSRPVGDGQAVASNLMPGNVSDLSWLDPELSTFWHPPSSISYQDLYHGFGRTDLLWPLAEPLCTYAGPKESSGRNPGFEVSCDGAKIKLKFAEVSSEPFAARIFDALGYHVDPTDYVPRVKIRYSRRMFQEFNSRKQLKTHFTFLGFIPLFTLELQKHYDPFNHFTVGFLRDGSRISASQLKRRLFRDPNRPHPEEDPSNFRPEVESDISYLETVPANIQPKTSRVKSIGPWDFGDLDHASRRELRGAGLLAAWLGWFDTRFDNTRLRIVHRDGQPELEHYFSDLGGVLGQTTGVLYARGERPNAFPWTFTLPPLQQGPHGLARPFRLHGYKPIAKTPAFASMTVDDARWMARLIGQLSEHQIEQALVASGFDSACVRLYLEKLLSRRDQMVLDLGLANEISLSRPFGTKHGFSYNPASDGPVGISVGGKPIEAPIGTDRVVNGKLMKSEAAAQSPSAAFTSHRWSIGSGASWHEVRQDFDDRSGINAAPRNRGGTD